MPYDTWKFQGGALTAGFISFFAALFFPCCVLETRAAMPPRCADDTAILYVLSNGWHTSIGLRSSDARGTALGEIAAEFPNSDYLVFGWGEEEYYRAPKVTAWITFKAIFLANPAALHVIGVRRRIEHFFNHSEIVAVRVSRRGFGNLARFLSVEFLRDRRDSQVLHLGHGYYPDSQFYAARGKYYLLKTCNVWTASVIREAGVRVNPTFALTADDLMWRVQPCGIRIQALKRPMDAF